jgi:aminopeptidase N
MPQTDHWRTFIDQATTGVNRRAVAPRFDDPALPEHYPPNLELEPTHLNIDLYISLPARSVGGRVTTTLFARQNGPTTLSLDAVDFEDLSVRDTEDRPLAWQYDGRKLQVTWSEPFAAYESRRLEVAYRVIAPTAGLYFAGPDTVYPQQPAYMISDHETERARHWLPCIDLPNVRTSLDFHLRADARHTLLANGYLVEEKDHGDGTKTAHWRLEQPCPSYLICVAVGEFTRADDGDFVDGDRTIPVAYFAGAEHSAENLLRTFGRTKRMLEWLTQLLDRPYPYPKYYQVALSVNTGAMENISLVAWTDRVVQDAALAREYGWQVDQVNVHEMAHAYFGDAVVCRDFAHAWLKESWATYIEQLWQEEYAGETAADYVYYLHRKDYFDEADNRYQRPIITRRFRSSWDLYDAHLYEGGACRLHMLNHELGTAVFWDAVRDYLKRYEHQVVETDDFRHVLEEHSGKSLGKFFDQWFRTAGFPDLKVEFVYDEVRHEATFTVEQKQVDHDQGKLPFTFTTDVGWVIAGELQTRTVTIEQAHQVVVVPMPEKPEMVRFDPFHKVLHRLDLVVGDRLLRTQLTQAKDVIGRIEAADALAKSAKHANLNAIVDAFIQEEFWGARCEFAEILGNANHATAIEGLAQLIAVEEEPRVLISLLRAAGAYRDQTLSLAIQARLQTGLNPIAAQSAYIALGKQREGAPYERLVTVAHGARDWRIQSGAFLGLAETRRRDAVPLLRRYAAYGGSPNRARASAVTALGKLGKNLEKDERLAVAEQLVDLLRDPWRAVQWAAARALGDMHATEAMPALEAFAASLSIQDQAMIERILEGLRKEDKTEGSAVQKQVETLRDKVRTLEQQLQALVARLDAQPDQE